MWQEAFPVTSVFNYCTFVFVFISGFVFLEKKAMKRRLNYMWQGVTLMAGLGWSPSARAQRPTSTSTLHSSPNVIMCLLSPNTAHHIGGQVKSMVYDTHQNSGAQGVLCIRPAAAMVLVSGGGAVAPQSTRTGRPGPQSPAPEPPTKTT